MTHILLVEDDSHIANGLTFNLEMEGYQITHLKDGESARKALFDQKRHFDLIILDVMLPHLNGFDLCYGLRKSENFVPVLMLTAKNFEKDKIKGLQLGADDYLTKPFNLEELLMRIQVLLRRQRWEQTPEVSHAKITFRDVSIDFESFEVQVGEQDHQLTPLEMKLMRYFADHENKVLSRDTLLDRVWDVQDQGSLRTVDNFVMRLRKLFEKDPAHPQHFLSIRGVGYKFTRQNDT